jgi:leader peptidase (prepilin peptidase) / N-methyltransferase
MPPDSFSGCVCDSALNRRLKLQPYPAIIWLLFLSSIFLYLALHDQVMIGKGILFAQLLIAAGYIDAKTKHIPDELCALIFLTSLIRPEPAQSLIGMLIVSVPLWVIGMLRPNSIGGGDIKLLAACGAVLGPSNIVAGTYIGMIAFLLFYLSCLIIRKKREKTYAMAPWFGFGCFLAYLNNMKG